MQAANIRNISLSLCLGLFSFHTYVVSSYNTSANLSSKFIMSSRNIASTPANCTSVRGVTDEIFKSDEYKPDTCEIVITLNGDTEANTVEIILYTKLGRHLISTDPITVSDVEVSVNDPSILGAIPEVRAAAETLHRENIGSLSEELTTLAAADSNAAADAAISSHIDANSIAPSAAASADEEEEATTPAAGDTGAIDGDATAPVDEDPTATPPDVTEVTANTDPEVAPEPAAGSIVAPTRQGEGPGRETSTPSDIDSDEIKAVFTKIDDFIDANNRCTLATSDSEFLEEVANDLKEALGIDRDIDNFSDDVRNREIRNLSQDKAETIIALGEDLDDIGDEGNDSDIQARISCLSASALRESSPEAQYLSYMENIRPLINGSIDGASSPQEKIAVLNSFSTNSAFGNLLNSNEVVRVLVQAEAQIATKVIECSAQQDKTACTAELQAGLTQLEAHQAQNPSAVTNDTVGIYKEWMSKLTGPGLTGALGSGTISDILGDANLTPGAAAGGTDAEGENEQDGVLRMAKQLSAQMAREAQAGSNRRSQVITPHQGAIPMLNDAVTDEQMSLQ